MTDSRASPHERAAEEFARRVGEQKGDAVSAVLLYEAWLGAKNAARTPTWTYWSFFEMPPTGPQKRTKSATSHTTSNSNEASSSHSS